MLFQNVQFSSLLGEAGAWGRGCSLQLTFSSVCQVLMESQDARGEGERQRRKRQDLHSKLEGTQGRGAVEVAQVSEDKKSYCTFSERKEPRLGSVLGE